MHLLIKYRASIWHNVPAFNTMFINISPNDKTDTTASTYLTSCDVDIDTGATTREYRHI